MKSLMKSFAAIACLAVATAFPGVVLAQSSRDANCSYQQCALGLAPVWNGLAVTRGDSERHAATLSFFLPADIRRTFEGDREAIDVATDAINIRRAAAVFTDAGLVLLATGLARAAFQREFDKFSRVLTVTGGVSLAAGVPLQFAADGLLSRAVWLYNRKFAK